MFRLQYSDGSVSEIADSIVAVQALYTGSLIARIQQRRSASSSGWSTISNDINGQEGAFVISVGDIADNSSVASTTLPDQPTTARSQVGTVNPATGLVTYTTEPDDEPEEPAWSPSQLTGYLHHWIAGVGQAVTGSNLTLWSDQGPGAADASQGSATMQPLVGTDGNGAYILFDGSNDYLLANGAAAAFTGEDKAVTVISVWTDLALSGTQIVWSAGNSSVSTQLHMLYGTFSSTVLRSYRRDDSGVAATSVNGTSAADAVQIDAFSGTNRISRINGTEISGAQNVGVLTLDQYVIAAQATGFGNVAGLKLREMVICAAELTLAERVQAEEYMTSKWGL